MTFKEGQLEHISAAFSNQINSEKRYRFKISDDGQVAVLEPLDYEERAEYRLIITAQVRPCHLIDRASSHCTLSLKQDAPDRLGQSSNFSSTLLVTVEDEPDEPPSFTTVISVVDLEEDTAVGALLFQIEAVDGDYANPKSVEYSVREIFNGCESWGWYRLPGQIEIECACLPALAEPIQAEEFFLEVSAAGEVTLLAEVDREAMGDTNNIYTVTFAAKEADNGCVEAPCEALTNATLRIQVRRPLQTVLVINDLTRRSVSVFNENLLY